MAFSLALIVLSGLLLNKIFRKLKLPGLLGMLIAGILIGPYGLDWIDESLLNISSDIRKIALLVILIRAGLGIKREALSKVGVSAFGLCFIPAIFEGVTIMFVASRLLSISRLEAGMLGFILAAVSPTVVVPQMLSFIERKMGEAKGIPTRILAGVSIEAVVSITIFSALLGMYGGKNVSLFRQMFDIPISIGIGAALGIILSMGLLFLFNHFHIENTKKILLVLGSAIMLTKLEDVLQDIVPIATLLAVMLIGFIILEKSPSIANQLSGTLKKIWVFAEIMLFVLVGTQVNIYLAADAGWVGLTIVTIGLMARSFGVFLSLLGTGLNTKEKVFCTIAYVPKATVQAAIAGVPLANGVASGDLILTIAVLAILITAPLGAIGIKLSAEKILTEERSLQINEIS
ncbi:sodium/proton antiporter, CPA1 family (TC 2.A.36) [Natronincola peptidivorans]|uniref:Sodium/proton antiporter, CPA1 family (TC 2.A.36) n=1 Tax=Natronincola peptidivorans TaxID=426128 RepID=A0A1I0DWN9_9FIRM|nr:cation:proton antiporter [Natronincola peptidivorans]SET37064.1 sodium/proton antiporter, CPA1 family (TC 2.A.36) [Natronincola peptidivorans]